MHDVPNAADKEEEKADSVERAYYPSYQAPSYGSPNGNNYGPSYAPSYGPSYSSYGANPLTDPSFHTSKATAAGQNLNTQGNGIVIGTIGADSYNPYPYGRRRRAAELEAATTELAEKLKSIIEAENHLDVAQKIDKTNDADEKEN